MTKANKILTSTIIVGSIGYAGLVVHEARVHKLSESAVPYITVQNTYTRPENCKSERIEADRLQNRYGLLRDQANNSESVDAILLRDSMKDPRFVASKKDAELTLKLLRAEVERINAACKDESNSLAITVSGK